jgi:hypothetical protein
MKPEEPWLTQSEPEEDSGRAPVDIENKMITFSDLPKLSFNIISIVPEQ